MNLIALFAILLLLSGCVTNQLSETHSLPRAGTGFVVATLVSRVESINAQDHLFGAPAISASFNSIEKPNDVAFVVATAGSTTGLIGLISAKPQTVLPEPNGTRTMVMVPVKPGKYKMGRLDGGFGAYNKVVKMDAANNLTIDVNEGEITYLGSFHLISTVGKNIIGINSPAYASLTIKDEYVSDLIAMKSIDPRLKELPISNGLATNPLP